MDGEMLVPDCYFSPVPWQNLNQMGQAMIISATKWYTGSNLSIKAPVCQWVSESVWMFPNSYETANPSELKFWGMIPLGMEKVLG